MIQSLAVPVEEQSQTGGARRMAIALTSQLGFDETQRGRVGLVVTEMANNLVRHACAGVLLMQPLERRGVVGIELLSLDRGPGIENIGDCLRDGYSTVGTSGNGLGAIARLSDLFEIYSQPVVGTAILCRLWTSALPPRTHPIQLGAVALPKLGEEVSGDAWWVLLQGGCTPSGEALRCQVAIADGLGHGILAAQAANEAVRIFQEQSERSPKEMLEVTHRALRSTRGAAMAIADINLSQQSVRFAGVGNISAMLLPGPTSTQARQNWVSFNGTVGHEVRKIQEYTYPWMTDGVLVMHSDGLGTQWRLEQYPGLIAKHPSLIAGVLYRDFYRQRDDVTIVIMRQVPLRPTPVPSVTSSL